MVLKKVSVLIAIKGPKYLPFGSNNSGEKIYVKNSSKTL